MIADCPNRPNGQHSFTYTVGGGIKYEYEPVSFGETAKETLYHCVQYSYLACSCGKTAKYKIVTDTDV